MEWLNYHHLYYFWVIAQEGSITKAAVRVRLTHSTLSAQLKSLEVFLGGDLFDRNGRRLLLTPFGAEIAAYAEDIFHLGSEVVDVARGRSTARRTPFRGGVVETIPRAVACRIFAPALAPSMKAHFQLRQDQFDTLLGMLAANRIQLIVSDTPPPGGHSYRVHTHLLGETDMLLYGTPALAARYAKDFPRSLAAAPIILPSVGTPLRIAMDRWFIDHGLRVEKMFECNDAGHLHAFGGCGHGLFPVCAAVMKEVEQIHNVVPVGQMTGVRERYYAVSLERKVRHPVVAAIIESAREILFHPTPARRVSRASR